jgi:hypothetical protein
MSRLPLWGALAALTAALAWAGSALRAERGAIPPEKAAAEMSRRMLDGAGKQGLRGVVRVAAGLRAERGFEEPSLEDFKAAAVEAWEKEPGWTVVREEDLERVRLRTRALAARPDPETRRATLERAFSSGWDWLAVCSSRRTADRALVACRLLDGGGAARLAGEAWFTPPDEYEAIEARAALARQALPWLTPAAGLAGGLLLLGGRERAQRREQTRTAAA